MSKKYPTYTQVLKGFQKFEEGMNVFLQAIDADFDRFMDESGFGPDISKEAMWDVHKRYRHLALAAQEKQDEAQRKREARRQQDRPD